MHQITLERALYMAGVDRTDDPFTRDIKLTAWMRESRAQLADDQGQRVPGPEVEILITKGNNHVSKS